MIEIDGDVKQWECNYQECGARCCARKNPLTLFDIKKIGELLDKDWQEFADFDEDRVRYYLKTDEKGCIFLNDDLGCRIYDTKPLVCRLLPFEITGVVNADEPLLHLKSIGECPGYGSGAELGKAFIWDVEKDATLYLHEVQKLCREFKKK